MLEKTKEHKTWCPKQRCPSYLPITALQVCALSFRGTAVLWGRHLVPAVNVNSILKSDQQGNCCGHQTSLSKRQSAGADIGRTSTQKTKMHATTTDSTTRHRGRLTAHSSLDEQSSRTAVEDSRQGQPSRTAVKDNRQGQPSRNSPH